jgi:hypothetical protein
VYALAALAISAVLISASGVEVRYGTTLLSRKSRHIRFGSEADIQPFLSDVRFTPESGHSALRQRLALFDYFVGAGEHEGGAARPAKRP